MDIKPRELEIKKIESGKYEGTEIVQLRPSIAFDPNFVKECRDAGVTEYIKREENEEEEE